MIGKIINMNITDAFISLQDGTTADISISQIPAGSKIGDTINIEARPTRITNDKLVDFF